MWPTRRPRSGDLQSLSKPFYDTSYKPTFFYLRDSLDVKSSWFDRIGVQAGAQHESNGQALPKSRSLNTFYFKPTVAWELPRGWQLSISPRLIGYVDMDENPDLERYRGYVEWTFGAEHRDGFKFTAGLRKGTGSGYGSAELTCVVAARHFFFRNSEAGFCCSIQRLGESLLDYNVRRADQFRLGFMVVP